MLTSDALSSLAASVVLYDADRDPSRVTIAGAGVGVTRGLSRTEARSAQKALQTSLGDAVLRAMPVDAAGGDAEALAKTVVGVTARLVYLKLADELTRYDILVCGSELVGQEEPAAAESRARSMRAVLVAELQRALAGDEPPATVRRSVPASAEVR